MRSIYTGVHSTRHAAWCLTYGPSQTPRTDVILICRRCKLKASCQYSFLCSRTFAFRLLFLFNWDHSLLRISRWENSDPMYQETQLCLSQQSPRGLELKPGENSSGAVFLSLCALCLPSLLSIALTLYPSLGVVLNWLHWEVWETWEELGTGRGEGGGGNVFRQEADKRNGFI